MERFVKEFAGIIREFDKLARQSVDCYQRHKDTNAGKADKFGRLAIKFWTHRMQKMTEGQEAIWEDIKRNILGDIKKKSS